MFLEGKVDQPLHNLKAKGWSRPIKEVFHNHQTTFLLPKLFTWSQQPLMNIIHI